MFSYQWTVHNLPHPDFLIDWFEELQLAHSVVEYSKHRIHFSDSSFTFLAIFFQFRDFNFKTILRESNFKDLTRIMKNN